MSLTQKYTQPALIPAATLNEKQSFVTTETDSSIFKIEKI